MKRLIKFAAAAAAITLLGLTGVYGYFSDSLTVTNHIALGDVNIDLKEYQKKGSTEVLYTNPKSVVPGESVSKIPRITNLAKPCWVRARIVYTDDRERVEGFQDEMLSGMSEDWVKRGEYYYFTKILKRKEYADLFQEVKVPAVWGEEHSGQKLGILIQAEAIQAANFVPDFSGISPWGNQKIQLCVHEEDGAAACRGEKMNLSVEFNGKAHKLVSVPGDFFINLGTAMPGDHFEDVVDVSNTTRKEAELFFHTAVKGQNNSQMEILKGIRLTIFMNEKKLYKGTLDSPELEKKQSLGKFQPEQKGKLKFVLDVPADWDNSFALRKADVQWIFSVNEEETTVPERTPQETGGNPSEPGRNRYPVKTSDGLDPEKAVLLFLWSGVSALAGLTYLICRKGGRKE